MTTITLDNLEFIRHADFRPWGCHMCKFHAKLVGTRFEPSDLYDDRIVFVKRDASQFLYSYVVRNYFPHIRVTPPTMLVVDTNRTRLDRFRKSAPANQIPLLRARQWRKQPLHSFVASVTPLYRHINQPSGRRLYDGTGDCTGFMHTRRADLFHVVFLDYLFGCRDRIANCFMMDGQHLVLDTGFSKDTMPSTVNFGQPSDYLEYHVRSDLCHLRQHYTEWYRNLVAFVHHPNWLNLPNHMNALFVVETRVVHARARVLWRRLNTCGKNGTDRWGTREVGRRHANNLNRLQSGGP